MAEQLRVFVSHASEDSAFCRTIVAALRDAGADVWYDEDNLGSGVLRREIMRELATRPIVLVILSKSAFASSWVQDECEWAYNLYQRKPDRLILPVVGGAYALDDFDTMLYLESMKRIEAAEQKPFPPAEAARRLLLALALTPAGAVPAPVAPQPSESANDLLTRGKALMAQDKYTKALLLFERAAQLAPDSFEAWANLGYVLGELGHYAEELAACDRALALDNRQAWVWGNKGRALNGLKRSDEALDAYDRALALDPNLAQVWGNKGTALCNLMRYDEALDAYDRALALDPKYTNAWYNKGNALYNLTRYDEALDAYERGFDPNDARDWNNKGNALNRLKRSAEALVTFDRALALDPNFAMAWHNKGIALRRLGRTAEAEEAAKRAKELGWTG